MGTLPFQVLFGKSPSQNTDKPLNSGEPHTYRLNYMLLLLCLFSFATTLCLSVLTLTGCIAMLALCYLCIHALNCQNFTEKEQHDLTQNVY